MMFTAQVLPNFATIRAGQCCSRTVRASSTRHFCLDRVLAWREHRCTSPASAGLRQLQLDSVDEGRLQPAVATLCTTLAALSLLLLLSADADAKLPPVKDPSSNVGYVTNKEVDKKRKKANFVRAYDGHVSIQNKYTKAWTDLKCDLQVPGLLLLRDATGEVFYLGYGGLKQIDLSDDQVVAAIATDDWENNMTPVEGPGETGAIERLEMTREGFYQLVSLTSGEDFEAELQEQAASKR